MLPKVRLPLFPKILVCVTVRIPGPTHDAVDELPVVPCPIGFQIAWITCGFLLSTGTTNSKLCAERVLRISSKSQSGLGPMQVPAPEAPVGLLQVWPVAQSAVAVQVPKVAAVHSVSCENRSLLTCWNR